MAAIVLSRPGTECGPCIFPCQHPDCLASRNMAESVCPICGQSIGYDRRFFLSEGSYVHAVCMEDKNNV